MGMAGKRRRPDGIAFALWWCLGLALTNPPVVVVVPSANALTSFPPPSSRSGLLRTSMARPQKILPSPRLSAPLASEDIPDAATGPAGPGQNQWRTVPSRILGDLFYGITSPFPDLRKVLRTRQTEGGTDGETGPEPVLSLPVRGAFLTVAAYLSVGVLSYHVLFEKWSIVDALYFSCVCFSTVGYGDMCPSTVAGKLFTCLFGFAGIALLGAAVASLGSKLVQLEVDALQRVRRESRRRVVNAYEKLPKLVRIKERVVGTGDVGGGAIDRGRVMEQVDREKLLHDPAHPGVEFPPHRKLSATLLATALGGVSKSLAVIVSGGLIIGRLEGWSAFDSVYYSLVTASTIGLGDFAPRSRAGRLAAVVLIPTLVAAAGDVLAGIGTALVERRQRKIFASQMQRGLTNEFIKAMDANGDGRVTREEYVAFMLVEMGLVDRHEIDELWQQFGRLDVTNSGHIDEEDLLLMQAVRKDAIMKQASRANV